MAISAITICGMTIGAVSVDPIPIGAVGLCTICVILTIGSWLKSFYNTRCIATSEA
jgi:hypothetical protein